jgi:hypothetical protein
VGTKVFIAAASAILAAEIGGVIAFLKPSSGLFSVAAAGALGSFVGFACGSAASFHRLARFSAGIGAVGVGIAELALIVLLVGAGVTGLLVHTAFAHLAFLSSAQRLAPVAAAAIAAGLVARWAQ